MKMWRNNRGDTIVEVLISIAVLSLILTTCFALANRSSQAVRQAQERSEALKFNEAQEEALKTFLSDPGHTAPAANQPFCLQNGAVVTFPTPLPPADAQADTLTNYPAECSAGTEDIPGSGGRYKTMIVLDAGAYTATTRWNRVTGKGNDELKIAYKVYLASATNIDLTGVPTTAPQQTCPILGQQLYNGVCGFACSNGLDDDGDTRADFPIDLGCTSGADTNETGPPSPATIAGNGDFSSWHLLNSGGIRTTRIFTLTNPANDAPLTLTNVTITGTNANTFSITANGCANRTLQPGQTCTVTVQFYPPSGGTNNRLGNAGIKNATLTVNNSSGVAATTTALVGRAYSDQAGPGDVITDTTQGYLRTYNPACYNNVTACGSALTGIQGNGNLSLGGTYCLWGGWGPSPGYGNYPFGQDRNRFVMQTDGNLVFYDPFTYRYASWTQGVPNLWLRIIDSAGGVYLHQNNPSVAYKWIHSGGSCFAW